ncbi:energy transducer TonB [Pareuzebyella sediminis]|uniref:energy transducer TonB n=1 Tax=Pareuzebyella sediminis TaxID=2607998 RepID=UPI0011F0907C|nr:energy transducer TonB [Pareuzebyella sediminis]
MKPKKNPHKDLNRNQSLYFVMALFLVLLMTFLALEWKTYDSNYNYDTSMNLQEELIEEVPITIHYKTPPPPPVKAPPIIEVVENKKDIEETFIDDSETDQEEEILNVEDIMVDEILEEPEEISFIVIEDVPVFPGCEKAKDKRACFQEMMKKHISKYFRYPEIAREMGIEGRVNTLFIIQKDGTIGNVQMRGPDKSLEAEALRIIDKLPKMVPGKQRGTPVRVPFSLPIYFKLQ